MCTIKYIYGLLLFVSRIYVINLWLHLILLYSEVVL